MTMTSNASLKVREYRRETLAFRARPRKYRYGYRLFQVVRRYMKRYVERRGGVFGGLTMCRCVDGKIIEAVAWHYPAVHSDDRRAVEMMLPKKLPYVKVAVIPELNWRLS